MTDILDTARKYVRDADAREYAERDISPTSAQTYAICRALIARTEALREIAAHAEFRAHDEDDASCLRGQLVTIGEAARKALAEEP